jgi:hypothetical protein
MLRIQLPAGTRVFHRVFGEGTVAGEFSDRDGSQGRVMVDWDTKVVPTIKWWYWDFDGTSELELLNTYGP